MLVWAGCLGLVPASQLKKKLINETFSFPSNCHSLIHQGKQRGRTSGNSSNEENKLCICLKQLDLLRAWAWWPDHRQEKKKNPPKTKTNLGSVPSLDQWCAFNTLSFNTHNKPLREVFWSCFMAEQTEVKEFQFLKEFQHVIIELVFKSVSAWLWINCFHSTTLPSIMYVPRLL